MEINKKTFQGWKGFEGHNCILELIRLENEEGTSRKLFPLRFKLARCCSLERSGGKNVISLSHKFNSLNDGKVARLS